MTLLDSNGKQYRRTVVFDVETTGLSPESGDRIVEIGAVALEGKTVVDEFHSLIDVERPIDPATQRIHGITREMLAGQPKADVVIPRFRTFIENSVMVAHYADFDLSFVGSEFRSMGLGFRQPYYCTLELSRKMFPELKSHDLKTLFSHLYGRPPKVLHRALEDAKIAAKIWVKIRRES